MNNCQHMNASALENVPCGAMQAWACEGWDGECGETFYRTKPHDATLYVKHAPTCGRRQGAMPAAWCGCETTRVVACIECYAEFPEDTQSGPGIYVF